MNKAQLPIPENYLVAFYDILGNGDSIRAWSNLSEWKSDNERVFSAFVETVKSILEIRSSFESLAGGLNNSDISDELKELRDQLDPEAVALVDKIRLGTIRHQSFSDTNIWFVKSTDESIRNFFYSKSMSSVFLGLSFCHLDALSNGLFCRGGLAYGVATDLGGAAKGDEIVGPALLDAYELESCAAKSARIAVGNSLVEFLDSRLVAVNNSLQAGVGEVDKVAVMYEQKYFTDMRSMVFQDSDRQWVLDFAGEANAIAISAVMDQNSLDPKEFYEKLILQVQNQVELHRNSGAKTHQERAVALQAYLEDRKKFWI